MKVISKILDSIQKVLGEQEYHSDKKYRPITYCKTTFIDDGVLLYSSLTRELLLLSYDEYKNFTNNKTNEFLVKHWFMVPNDIDDSTLLYLFDRTYKTRFPRNKYGKFNLCTIITTTDCNARCPYCYQHGIERKFMSDKVALDVAKFIEPRANTNLTMNWFGGEPLYNSKVIDIICNYFKENEVNFSSIMTSNGILFDKFSVDTLKNIWKLKKVQITLDGTESIYNKTKRYIYKDIENPFEKVTNNIEYLASNNIYVNIRLNLSPDNIDDMFNLVEWLSNRYVNLKNKSLSVYSRVLFDYDYSSNLMNNISKEQRSQLYSRHLELQDCIKANGLSGNLKIPKIKRCHCMADDGRSTVINPDGNLSLCEHFIDREFYGSIYDRGINRDVLNKFLERQEEIEECKTCFYRPECFRLKMCEPEGICDEENRKINEHKTITMMKDVYKNYKNHKAN